MNLRAIIRKMSIGDESAVSSIRAFTLAELLVSVVILGVATGAIVQASNIALTSSKRSSSAADIQNLVSLDLNWLRWYGKAWNCESGSYATCTTNLSTTSVLSYPENQSCATLVSRFLNAASSADLATAAPDRTFPVRPFPVPSSPGSTQLLQEVNGVPLNRIIRMSSSSGATAQPRSLEVLYTYAGQPPIQRFASVLIQAGGWCDAGSPDENV
jgi:prepilin-type N-terminal cleavage/methylation domain-containing protein